MNRLLSLLRFVSENLGPTIVFFVFNHVYGLKAAILASTIFSVADLSFKLLRGRPVTSLFLFSAVTTLLFGAIDLYAEQPFLLRYESVVTNIITGLFFGASLFKTRSVIEEIVMQDRVAEPVSPELARFFRLFTLIWVAYFFVKAAIYYVIANRYSLEQAMLIRSSFGGASLYLMIFGSTVGGRSLFLFFQRRGWLGSPKAA